MPDIAQARAEKAYPIQKESPYATNYIAAAKQEGYVLGWTESQREPISDAELSDAFIYINETAVDDEVTRCLALIMARYARALEAAARVSTLIEPISDAEVEALAKSLLASNADAYHGWLRYTDTPYHVLRAALTAAARARVSAESEKP